MVQNQLLLAFMFSGSVLIAQSLDFAPKQQPLTFLTETIDWYRHLSVTQQLATDSSDLLFLEGNRPISAQIVKLSFEYA